MDSDAILRAAGLSPVLVPRDSEIPPSVEICTHEPDYPIALVSTTSTIAVVSTLTLAYLTFKLRRIISRYIGHSFSYALSDRRDLIHELTYTFRVGEETLTAMTISNTTGEIRRHQPIEMLPALEVPADVAIEMPSFD